MLKAVQVHSKPPAFAVLLLSSSDASRASLFSICAGRGWTVYEAGNSREALSLLDRHAISVVIVDEQWREVLLDVTSKPKSPCVIVTAAFADEALWAEVLNLGGFDVLAQPFDANEVIRITQAAFRHSTLPDFHPLSPNTNAFAAV